MPRGVKSKLANAISAALELDWGLELNLVARNMVIDAFNGSNTSMEARAQLGNVSHSTYERWKRQLGLKVRARRTGVSRCSSKL